MITCSHTGDVTIWRSLDIHILILHSVLASESPQHAIFSYLIEALFLG